MHLTFEGSMERQPNNLKFNFLTYNPLQAVWAGGVETWDNRPGFSCHAPRCGKPREEDKSKGDFRGKWISVKRDNKSMSARANCTLRWTRRVVC